MKMADSAEVEGSSRVNEKSSQEDVKQVMRKLEGWREILIPVHSVLVWEKPYFPGIIAAINTFIFLMIWYCDLSVLTTLSVVGLLAAVLDYSVPLLSTSLFDPAKWTGVQQRQYEEICQNVVQSKSCLCQVFCTFKNLKESKPKVYFVVALVSLILLAWIGNTIDNLFLTYLIVLSLLMIPGMKRNGTVKKLVGKGALAIKDKLGKQKKN